MSFYDSSDMQLAIALQQQEFDQQQPQQPQRVLPQSPTTSRSGLVVGPQVTYFRLLLFIYLFFSLLIFFFIF